MVKRSLLRIWIFFGQNASLNSISSISLCPSFLYLHTEYLFIVGFLISNKLLKCQTYRIFVKRTTFDYLKWFWCSKRLKILQYLWSHCITDLALQTTCCMLNILFFYILTKFWFSRTVIFPFDAKSWKSQLLAKKNTHLQYRSCWHHIAEQQVFTCSIEKEDFS